MGGIYFVMVGALAPLSAHLTIERYGRTVMLSSSLLITSFACFVNAILGEGKASHEKSLRSFSVTVGKIFYDRDVASERVHMLLIDQHGIAARSAGSLSPAFTVTERSSHVRCTSTDDRLVALGGT